MVNQPTQPDLFPERTVTTLTVKGSDADAAVARVRSLGGVLLSFTTQAGGMIELHTLLSADMIQRVVEGRP